jgi:ATP synthase, H+ transporting, mitochondrial F0 complex, subunit s
VDPSRIKEVGPDRACAEWLLRCGAGLRWKNSKTILKDYNSLPVTSGGQKIAEIDATGSAIMDCGFPYFSTLIIIILIFLNFQQPIWVA